MEIYQKIINIMSLIKPIEKDEVNKQQGYKFRGIDTVYNELHSLLAKEGVFTVPEILEDRSEERETKTGGNLIYRILKIKYTFYAADGSSFYAIVQGEGMDGGDKATNKAMAAAHKYLFIQVFCLPTEEQKDPDYETPEPSKPRLTQSTSSKEKPEREFNKELFLEKIQPYLPPAITTIELLGILKTCGYSKVTDIDNREDAEDIYLKLKTAAGKGGKNE